MTRRFQYVVVRYVPNVIRDEAVNVGIVCREVGKDTHVFKFLPRSATVRKLWPTADQKLVAHFQRQLSRTKRLSEVPSLFGDESGALPSLDGNANVPVSTNTLPASGPPWSTGSGSPVFIVTPASDRRLISA